MIDNPENKIVISIIDTCTNCLFFNYYKKCSFYKIFFLISLSIYLLILYRWFKCRKVESKEHHFYN